MNNDNIEFPVDAEPIENNIDDEIIEELAEYYDNMDENDEAFNEWSQTNDVIWERIVRSTRTW